MSRLGCHKRGWVALLPGVWVCSPCQSGRAAAQDPVIIPGLPGASLPAGARPAPTVWPYRTCPAGDRDAD